LDLPVDEADQRYDFFRRDLAVRGSDACKKSNRIAEEARVQLTQDTVKARFWSS
jgi:hypothetical protein